MNKIRAFRPSTINLCMKSVIRKHLSVFGMLSSTALYRSVPSRKSAHLHVNIQLKTTFCRRRSQEDTCAPACTARRILDPRFPSSVSVIICESDQLVSEVEAALRTSSTTWSCTCTNVVGLGVEEMKVAPPLFRARESSKGATSEDATRTPVLGKPSSYSAEHDQRRSSQRQ